MPRIPKSSSIPNESKIPLKWHVKITQKDNTPEMVPLNGF